VRSGALGMLRQERVLHVVESQETAGHIP
jgi:hypothetical protein